MSFTVYVYDLYVNTPTKLYDTYIDISILVNFELTKV